MDVAVRVRGQLDSTVSDVHAAQATFVVLGCWWAGIALSRWVRKPGRHRPGYHCRPMPNGTQAGLTSGTCLQCGKPDRTWQSKCSNRRGFPARNPRTGWPWDYDAHVNRLVLQRLGPRASAPDLVVTDLIFHDEDGTPLARFPIDAVPGADITVTMPATWFRAT